MDFYQEHEEKYVFKRRSTTFDKTLRDRELLDLFEGETFAGAKNQVSFPIKWRP
jgi:hypothetical protein